MTLKDLKIGESGRITLVGGEGALRQHFLDMGLIPGTEVKVVKLAPLGDPVEIELRGYELTLRINDASNIQIEQIETINKEYKRNPRKRIAHLGLGEDGKYHSKEDEIPVDENEILQFALVGNQNCGKTTLFNQLTGSKQHVGNFPGVTVDKKSGSIRNYDRTLITDLPGIYSMSPYSCEEIVSRNFVLDERPHAIINILDATNIERNLYLTMQLLEMNIPMVVALNMMDEVVENDGAIDINRMEAMLGVPVIPISASKNEGVDELVKHAIHVAKYQEKPIKQDFCDESSDTGAVHRCIHAICHLIEDHTTAANLPIRFAASKVIENDEIIVEALKLDINEKEMIEHIVVQMESERSLDRNAAMADMRFSYIKKVCDATVIKPRESKERIRSLKLDKIFTGKYTAIPCFIIAMLSIFYLTFNVIGAFFQNILEGIIDKIAAGLDRIFTDIGVNPVIHRLVIDGIFQGVGSVLSFLPIIVIMFFFLSLLEDSGYIARVAFVMDKLLRKIGLSGRSIVPLLIGFGCSVPAIMSTRTLPSERDRKMTILLTPFMSCSAKLPVYAFFVATFFPNKGGIVMSLLYILGILLGILVALIFKGTLFKGEAVPFVMELPNYRFPGMRNTAQLLWEKSKDFLQKAFSVILIATIVVWFLQSFDLRLNLVEDSAQSIIAQISGLMVPLLRPIGLGDWRICTALISGVMAKESMVSTIEILYSRDGGILSSLSGLEASSLLVFSLLYTPCVAAIASVKNEMGKKWAVGVVLFQCFLAWIVSFLVYSIGLIL